MIITRTPLRVSFFGGGTDYPLWYRENGGSVISTTIDKYCHIICRPLPRLFDYTHVISYAETERVRSIDEIKHPAVREILRFRNYREPIELVYRGDLPARSGLGSSSAFSVGFLHATAVLAGKEASKRELARDAIHIEQNIIGENVGSQDQVAVAYGGFNHIRFLRDGTIETEPLAITDKNRLYLESSCMLFFTGLARPVSEISHADVADVQNRKSELGLLSSLVDEAAALLSQDTESLREFGLLLDTAWQLKRSIGARVTNSSIDGIYEKAKKNGALGGKILGAGGGGFMFLFVEPERQESVKRALSDLPHVPFRFENEGTTLIYHAPVIH